MSQCRKSTTGVIIYKVYAPKTHIMLSYYRSETRCEVNFGFDINNDSAVAILSGKDFTDASQKEFLDKAKLALKSLVGLCVKEGVQVPGLAQMDQYFKSNNQK